MNSNSKPIFSLTVDEFIEALREGLGFSDSSSADENALTYPPSFSISAVMTASEG